MLDSKLRKISLVESKLFILGGRVSELEARYANIEHLSNGEKERARNMADSRRLEFSIGRNVLYETMNNLDDEKVEYSIDEKGKLQSSSPWQFNISHCNDFIVWAFELNSPIGIDIERTDRTITDLAQKKVFSEWERTQCSYFDPITFWAIKESILKSTGIGISVELREMEVVKEEGFFSVKKYPDWRMYQIDVSSNHTCFISTKTAF